MSYVDGETLGERLRTRGPLPPADATRVLREVAWALAYAHGRGIVHRDVKPDNIMLEAGTGRALVTDFGIAHGGEDLGRATDPGKIMGTAHYMSPEQAASEPVDGRSDIYSLGVVGYLAVSGRLPFESSNVPALLVRQATEAPPSVMLAAPGLPPALGAAIDRCLARDPADRFADGEALAEALAPAPDARPALPPTLRAWLAARNPLLVPYMAWSGLFGTLTTINLVVWLTGNRPDGPADIVRLGCDRRGAARARRRFPRQSGASGSSAPDTRSPIFGRRSRSSGASGPRPRQWSASEGGSPTHRGLRVATVISAAWLAVTFVLLATRVIHENRGGLPFILVPLFSTLALGAVSNALDVQFIPTRIREWWQTGIRERLWNSRVGEWLARKLGAPERSKLAGASAFRATEAALGVAASELFAALPKAYKEQLADLPAIVGVAGSAGSRGARRDGPGRGARPVRSWRRRGAGCAEENRSGASRRERRRARGNPSRPSPPARGRRRSCAAHDADGRRAGHWRGRESTRGGAARGRGRCRGSRTFRVTAEGRGAIACAQQ